MNVPTILLMLKAPVEGTVKTRLAADIGSVAATLAYRSLVEHQMRQIPSAWRIHVCFAPPEAQEVMEGWLGSGVNISPQSSGDLGNRLENAVRHHFEANDGYLIVLGGDCPYLDTEVLQGAKSGLENAEVVLVPALDGGYCLVGMRKEFSTIFREISWSTADVLSQTRERLREAGISWIELGATEDVDDYASWKRATDNHPHLAKNL